MICARILLTAVGFGTCLVGMSLMKKLFHRKKVKVTESKETVSGSATLNGLSNEGLLDATDTKMDSLKKSEGISSVVTSTSSSSQNSTSAINQSVRKTRKKLNSTLRKYRKTEKKLRRKQNEIIQMENEIQSLMQVIKNKELQLESLHADFNDKQLEMLAITSCITPESEAEIKKKEILCYKRYSNIKSIADARSVLGMIRQRQKALKTLEILTFKRYWSLAHHQDVGDTSFVRSGIENWFRQFGQGKATTESSQEITQDEEKDTEQGYVNQTFVSVGLLEATL